MSRFDDYVSSNDTPKTLCKEIEELQKIILNMRSCTICENLTLFSDTEEPCINCGDFKHFKLRSKKENEKTKD